MSHQEGTSFAVHLGVGGTIRIFAAEREAATLLGVGSDAELEDGGRLVEAIFRLDRAQPTHGAQTGERVDDGLGTHLVQRALRFASVGPLAFVGAYEG